MENRMYARNPIIALDYSEKHKAVKKELLIDYNTGNIYVVSAEDRNIIFDITAKIQEQLKNMQGDNITITIEGIGEVNLVQYLKYFQQQIDDSVKAVDTGKEANYVAKEFILDNRSVEAINKTMQLKGFNKAEPLMIPRKSSDGELEWIELPMVPDDPGSGGGGSIIPPGNPDDSEKGNCYIIEPVNDKIYLRASRRQKTLYLDRNCKVILPRILDEFSEINWFLVTKKDFQPFLSFGPNVFWQNMEDTQPDLSSYHIYLFKTWDRGETWFGKVERYNRSFSPDNPDGIVDMEYLQNNYYNKDHIDSNYFDKEQMDVNYYDKPEVDELISWDLSPEAMPIINNEKEDE